MYISKLFKRRPVDTRHVELEFFRLFSASQLLHVMQLTFSAHIKGNLFLIAQVKYKRTPFREAEGSIPNFILIVELIASRWYVSRPIHVRLKYFAYAV